MSWNPSALLDTLDRGYTQPPVCQTFLLLEQGKPTPPDTIWATRIGQSNLQLLDVCQSELGMTFLHGVANCPACGSQLETSLSIEQIQQWLSGDDEKTISPQLMLLDDFRITLRDVNLADLRAAADAGDLESARNVLFNRCIVLAEQSDLPIAVDRLPANVLEAVSAHLGKHDPAGDPRIGLSCADCGQQFDRGLDLTAHAWSGLDAAAVNLQDQVVALAGAFGWTEADVFALSPRRRASYLKLIGESE